MLTCVATHVLVLTSLLTLLVDILNAFAFLTQFIAIVEPVEIESTTETLQVFLASLGTFNPIKIGLRPHHIGPDQLLSHLNGDFL